MQKFGRKFFRFPTKEPIRSSTVSDDTAAQLLIHNSTWTINTSVFGYIANVESSVDDSIRLFAMGWYPGAWNEWKLY